MKRDLSPAEHAIPEDSSKKPKRGDKVESIVPEVNVDVSENRENDNPSTNLYKDTNWLITSPGPNPGSKQDSSPEPWVQQLFSMLKGIKDDITTLRNDISTLQNRLNFTSNKDSNHFSNVHLPDTAPNPKDSMDFDIHEPTEPDAPNDSQLLLPPHASFLHKCFQHRIGLQPTKRNEVSITTFDGVLIAKGFNRIVPTWQGYYIELEHNDVVWASLKLNQSSALGEESWTSPGLTVFTLTRPDNRRTPRRHRFARMTPSNHTLPCNPLHPNKYYIHAYQARFLVDNYSRSLNSRSIASNLAQMFPDQHHPRWKGSR